MLNYFFKSLLYGLIIGFFLFSFSLATGQSSPSDKGINICSKLNTDVPYICSNNGSSSGISPGKAFPTLIAGMSKLTIAFIMIFSFLMLILGGILISLSGADQSAYAKGKELILKVIVGIILLGSAGVILHIINPNFFK